jgi:hypothetical protein
VERINFVILTLLSFAFRTLAQDTPSNQDGSRSITALARIATETDKAALKETLVKKSVDAAMEFQRRSFLRDCHVHG